MATAIKSARISISACVCVRARVCVCVSPPVPKGPMPPFPLPPLNKAGGHPPPQWRMANEEATGGAANVPAELLYKLSLHSFFVSFHGGSCYFP